MAPTFRHGKKTRIAVGSVNASSFLNDSSIKATVDTAETTVYTDDDKTYVAGHKDHTVSYSGLFDGSTEHAHEVFDNALGTPSGSTDGLVNTYGVESDDIGRHARLFVGGPTSLDIASPGKDVVSVSVEQNMNSKMGYGQWLHDMSTPITLTTGASTFASAARFGSTASSTKGGAVHFHVTAYASTGSWIVKTQHSSNASAWVDLTTARTLNSTRRVLRVETGATIKRYVKAIVSSTASTNSDPTIGIAVGRYR